MVYPPGKIPYDTNTAFVPISGLVRINQALLAKKSLPADNAAQLITLAKHKPGQLTFGTAGLGSAPHMNIELFENMAGVKFTPVHYRGAVPALNDVRSGTVDLMSVSVSLALPPYRAGQIKILGIGSAKRLPQAADIPTVAETGLPGYEAVTWFGLFGPAGMPHDLVTKLNAEVHHIFEDPAFRKRFLDPQMFDSMPGTPEEFAAFVKTDQAKWSKVIHDRAHHDGMTDKKTAKANRQRAAEQTKGEIHADGDFGAADRLGAGSGRSRPRGPGLGLSGHRQGSAEDDSRRR